MTTETAAPVYLSIRAEIINAPKDIQAIVAIEQVIRHLDLTAAQQHQVLKFMADRAEMPF